MSHALVDQVRHKARCRQTDGLVIAPEATLELDDQPMQQQLADVWELGVYDGYQCGVHVREGRRSSLRLDDRATQQPAATDYVFAQQLARDHANVVHVHLVDEAVDGLFQRFPRDALIGCR